MQLQYHAIMQNGALNVCMHVAIAVALLQLRSVLSATAQEAGCKARDSKVLWSKQMFI